MSQRWTFEGSTHECVKLRGGKYITTCGGTFCCSRCKKVVGWCLGGFEEDKVLDGLCNDCWAEAVVHASDEEPRGAA